MNSASKASVYERNPLLYWPTAEQALWQALEALPPAPPVFTELGALISPLLAPSSAQPKPRAARKPAKEKAMSSREEKKQQTRQQLLDAALGLAHAGGGFAALSLREVTREAGLVPTAFYRHFKDMDELGLALVDDACLTLRRLLREARMQALSAGDMAIRDSVRTYLGHVRVQASTFQFLTRERSGGSKVVREAIAREIRFFMSELATDLRFFPPFKDFPATDLDMIADLVVNTLASLAHELLSLPAEQPRLEQDLETRAIKQLRLIFLGAARWKPELGAQSLG